MNSKMTHIRMTARHKEWLKRESTITGLSIAEIIRAMINEKMEASNEK